MTTDRELLTEVALELWKTTKKLRPTLPKAPRAQLVLKALLTIGDISDQLQAAMILGVIEAQEPDDKTVDNKVGEEKFTEDNIVTVEESRSTPRVVRKRTSAS
ncbi:TIGR03894 family protein [Synechococcus sp. M16CYN]|uniref:TIGR03894 family protein n=1 Tax=Synechococcus sp. M16CYN TaxID=3103139 RepID=UPI00333E6C67